MSFSVLVAFDIIAIGYHLQANIVPASVKQVDSSITAHGLLSFTNQARKKAGLPPLKIDGTLTQQAQLKVADMVQYKYFDNKDHDGNFNYAIATNLPKGCTYAGQDLELNRTVKTNKSIPTSSKKAIAQLTATKQSSTNLLNKDFNLVGYYASNDYVVVRYCQIK